MPCIGSISELWRYPVKSMRGEVCKELAIDSFGIEGDRRLAFESTRAPIGKPLLSSIERASMLRFQPVRSSDRPAQAEQHALEIVTPEGAALSLDDPLLRPSLAEAGEQVLSLRHRERPFTDVRPIALHSRATAVALANELGAFDARRLRSNIVLALHDAEPFSEDRLSGRVLRLGVSARLLLLERIPRCRMVSLDPETAQSDPAILRELARRHGGRVGIYARPLRTGLLRLGDPVWLEEDDEAGAKPHPDCV